MHVKMVCSLEMFGKVNGEPVTDGLITATGHALRRLWLTASMSEACISIPYNAYGVMNLTLLQGRRCGRRKEAVKGIAWHPIYSSDMPTGKLLRTSIQ